MGPSSLTLLLSTTKNSKSSPLLWEQVSFFFSSKCFIHNHLLWLSQGYYHSLFPLRYSPLLFLHRNTSVSVTSTTTTTTKLQTRFFPPIRGWAPLPSVLLHDFQKRVDWAQCPFPNPGTPVLPSLVLKTAPSQGARISRELFFLPILFVKFVYSFYICMYVFILGFQVYFKKWQRNR